MASDSDNLRRSKRNKYHLDVTTLSLANPEKKRNSSVAPMDEFIEATPSPGSSVPEIQTLSVENGSDTAPAEENKRSRRPTAKNASFVYADESEDEEEKVTSGMYGNFKCDKCPSRFESKPGLANHIRLHGRSDKRKFGCDQCDFSCGSAKAIRNHKRIHNRPLFKEESPPVTHSDTRSDTSDSHTPPLLTPVRTEAPPVEEATPNSTGEPPKLAAVSPSAATKTAAKSELPSRKRNRCPDCPFMARNRIRYERHIMMHSKSTGFQCHSCSLTTQSSGFLKRHIVEIHKETDYPWPPKFIAEARTNKVHSEVRVVSEGKKKDRAKVLLRSVQIDGEKMLCPVEACTFFGFTRNQISLHKRRAHSDKTKKTSHNCCTCGLKLRTPGALRVHRLTRHPRRKICVRAKKTLFKEANPTSRLKKIITEMKRNAVVSSLITTSNSEHPTPAPSPPQLPTSQSAPSLTEASDTVSSSLLGSNLPNCLVGLTFSVKDLAAEREKNHEHELRCTECPYTTNVSASLERHVAKHNLPAEFQCPLCSFCCRGEDLLKQHVRLHMAIIWKRRQEAEKLVEDLPQIVSSTVTPVKNSENSSPSKLLEEKRSAQKPSCGVAKKRKATNTFINKDGIRMRRCLECPYSTKHACDLASHYNMHVNEPQKFKCTQCTYSTKRAISLKTHYQCHRESNREQENVKPLSLKINGVNMGIRTGQGNNRIYSCRQCPFVARGIVLLNQHYRNHIYTKGASYKCSKCLFYSSQCEVVEEHILIHSEMDVQTVRLVPLTRGKRSLEEAVGRTTSVVRAKRTPRGSNCPSPAPPVLVKEEPMDYESSSNSNSSKLSQQKLELDEDSKDSLDRHPSPDIGKPKLGHSYDQPLSIQVQKFLQPEPALLRLLRKEGEAEKIGQCPDCPYADNDELLMRLHRECHQGPPRLQKCDLCSFSCMAPEALHKHMSLHLPALSPSSERLERKKAAHRRRSAANEVIPQGVPHFACSKCSFKSMTKDTFQEHMIFHAQELQRRLLTTIKRASIQAEEMAKSAKAAKSSRRAPKKSDKFHSCPLCSFRCETINAFIRHSEMHSLDGLHKCSMCSYSASTYSVTLFHEMNHHSDHTLAGLTKSAILAPTAITMEVERTEEKIRKLADNVFRCNRCEDFTCFELLQLRRHFEEFHYETPDDKATVESLAMGMLPSNTIITTA